MPQKYAGRLTLTIVVLLVGLFGIPFICDGIFKQSKLFAPVPISEKLNLKPGIDIAGGTRLIYKIEEPPGGWHGTTSLAEQVASILKRRVDPTGTKNLVWQAIGRDQLKIEIPRSSARQEEVSKLKGEYRSLVDAIDKYNIAPTDVIDAVEHLKGKEREDALKKLAMGSPEREKLFADLVTRYDSMKSIESQLADLRKAAKPDNDKIRDLSLQRAQAVIDYESARNKIDATNLSVADLEMRLDTPSDLNKKEVADLKARFPERKALIDQLETTYPNFKKVRDSVDDAATLRQQLKGSGVLEFHILVGDPLRETSGSIKDMVARFMKDGDLTGTKDLRWFPYEERVANDARYSIAVGQQFPMETDGHTPARATDDEVRQWEKTSKDMTYAQVKTAMAEGHSEINSLTPVSIKGAYRWMPARDGFSSLFTGLLNKRDLRVYGLAWISPEKSMVHSQSGGRDWALQSARTAQSERGDLIVGFDFDDLGGKYFAQLTGNNIGQQLATILDNKIVTAPTIKSQIHKSGTIDGGSRGYTESERNYLINTLNAGALPAQLNDEPKVKEVAPLLGEANLRAGLYSCLIALAVVGAFMTFYYRLSGVVAAVALLFNMTTIIGVLAMMGATFTLPGIAGLVLTIGVSVDANVLIFERLREEERRGLSLKLALRNAYDRAFTAILDSNVTTAITSAFLAYFGSAEVRGFGLTLLIGILSSMFAALFVTKTLFAVLIEKFGVKKLGSFPLSNPWWERIMHPNINWMGLIPHFLTFSVIFTVVGMTAFIQNARTGTLLDVEFAPGTELTFKVKTPMTDNQIRELMEKRPNEIPQPLVVAVGGQVEPGKYMEFSVQTSNPQRRAVEQAVLDVMSGKLDIVVPSRFQGFSEKPGEAYDQAVAAGILRPIVLKDNRFLVDGKDVIGAGRKAEGVAVVLKNLSPPLKPAEIESRIRTMLDENPQMAPLKVDVVRLDGQAADRPTDYAVVMLKNPTFPYSKQEGDWREKVAMPFWKAVNAGVGRDASFSEVNNTDAQVAGDAQMAALLATIGSLFAIMIWIWVRFGDHKYGTATVMAMIHDTILVVGAVGMSHWLAGTVVGNILGIHAFRVNMTLVAAILTIMGYSMVDTIVVFDRIRENRGKYGAVTRQLINDSVNQTLSRTLLTAGTTMMTVLVMYIWGGAAIHGFTFVMLIGILIGTYSSVAIAAPILLMGHKEVVVVKKADKPASGAVPSVQARP